MSRQHLYYIAQDGAGNAQAGASVRLLQSGTTNLVSFPIYADNLTISPMGNPFTTASGEVSIYTDSVQRVDIGITPTGGTEQIIADIDIGGAGSGGDSSHVGLGSASTQVGLSASSGGASSLAVAQQASSGGDNSVAAGYAASSAGQSSTAVGYQSTSAGQRGVALGETANAAVTGAVALGSVSAATGLSATSVGDTSTANSQKATAVGANATAGNTHSAAVGADAATTEQNQVMLGTSSDVAEAPGGYILTAADGKRARLRMLPDGTLTTIWHVPAGTANLLPTAEQDFETGIGSWAAVSGLSSVAQSTDYAVSGTHSLKCTLSGSTAASARSSKPTAVAAQLYVGIARMFYHAGAMTSGLNGTLWLEFYDSGNILLGSAVAGRTRAFFPDAWIYFDVRALAPASTATVALRAGLPTGGGVNGDVFYVDLAGIYPIAGSI